MSTEQNFSIEPEVGQVAQDKPSESILSQAVDPTVSGWRARLCGAVVAAEMIPFIGGTIRYGGAAAVLATTKSPELSTAYLMASTAVVEGASAVAAPVVIKATHDKSLVRKFDSGLDKLMPRDRKLGVLGNVVLTNYLGPAALEYAYHRVSPDMDKKQLRKIGGIATAALVPAVGIQGYLLSKGIVNLTDAKISVPAFGALAGIIAVGSRLMKQLRSKEASLKQPSITE